ncbi:hypothetical protein RHSIM_Rhsim11G0058800 [Rhododendron simsii]|uniref:50S ribosomal protein L21, chloroplastic n=1 Tax=Rhododendron simsii TaxID=118357 RepID=A0A834G6X9_RHOSS|nr:hypothetical protein RHSIM_Rhsim11G0058800 [Rhododendron simsii]
MATPLSSLCSSLVPRPLSLEQSLTSLPFSKTHFNLLSLTPSLSSHRLISSSSPRLPTLSFVPKSSETEPAVLETEPAVLESEPDIETLPKEEVESALKEASREEIFGVVQVGGRQFFVIPGRYIYTQRFKGAKVNDKVILNKVLLVSSKTKTWLGLPLVPNTVVHAVIEEQGLNDKVIVQKYKRKKNYRRRIGHRQVLVGFTSAVST